MSCAKVFLFFFNAIYLGIAAGVIYLAAWLIKKFGDISKITTDTYTLVPCGILIGIGVVILITALFGCCGVGRDSKCCLSVFVFLLLVVFALEVTVGVVGYLHRNKAEDYVNDGFIDAIKRYNPQGDSSLKEAVDGLQKNLECCGSKGPSDWGYSKYYSPVGPYPNSCCSYLILGTCSPMSGLYKEGCLNKLTDEVKHNLSYVLGTAIGIAVFQLLGIVGAFYLMCCRRERGYLMIQGGIHV